MKYDFGPEVSDNPDINPKIEPNVVSIKRIETKRLRSFPQTGKPDKVEQGDPFTDHMK